MQGERTTIPSGNTDTTLPSVSAVTPGNYREEALVLTLAFHPDGDRIGESAVLRGRTNSWTLGRLAPDFHPSSACGGRPLQDLHVSRRALQLQRRDSVLEVTRLPDASRCRLDGRELTDDTIELSREQLLAGVPVMLGHSVVLLLRLGTPAEECEIEIEDGGDLVGRSAYMASLREQIRRVAGSDLDVLIRGETGTGKELVAQAIHRASGRAGQPLVTVNMAAIPTGLAAAALFGSARGAYTGSDRASEGYFQQAAGGSLFLDEVGDTDPEIQPQLLRALQQREIQPVGGRVKRVELRVISATDGALEGEGCDFKSALRHRLGAGEVHLRPLRDHPEDIGELLWHFLSGDPSCRDKLPASDSEPGTVAAWAELFHRCLFHDWPGNVRELQNCARQAALGGTDSPVIPSAVNAPGQRENAGESRGAERNLRDIGDAEFDRTMESLDFEVAAVSRRLQVSRQAIYRRIADTPHHRLATQVPSDELQAALADHGGDAAATARQLRVSASGLRARLRNSGLEWR
jgi:DNA-binding NtrC family response regulator